jgi:hypothetical protein
MFTIKVFWIKLYITLLLKETFKLNVGCTLLYLFGSLRSPNMKVWESFSNWVIKLDRNDVTVGVFSLNKEVVLYIKYFKTKGFEAICEKKEDVAY